MPKSKPLSRIVWSIDAFNQGSVIERCAAFLSSITERSAAQIFPTYVLQPAAMNLTTDPTSEWLSQYEPGVESALQNILRPIFESGRLSGLQAPKIVHEPASSTRSAIRALTHHAEGLGADLIIAGTHARSGMERFLLGSFAESLVVHSPIPVVVVGPTAEIHPASDSILFPTDLGENSRAFFETAVNMAAQMKLRLCLFHSVPHPVEAVVQHGMYLLGGAWAPVGTQLATDIDERKKKIEAFVRWAERKNVHVDTILHDHDGNENLQLAVSQLAAEPRFRMIAIGSQSGPVAAALMGSVSRELVRHAPRPVWILHHAKKRARKPVPGKAA